MKLANIILGAIAFVLFNASSHAALIDFEEISATSNYSYIPSYSEEGYTFTNTIASPNAFCSPGTSTSQYSGSQSLAACIGYSTVVLSKDDGGLFSLSSIDLGEWSGTAARTVSFTGILADGNWVSESLTLDGVRGMETFSFASLENVESVRWSQTGLFHHFDNLVIDDLVSVDAPASLALLLMGVVALRSSRRVNN